jgi:hypothetical protein
MYYTDGRIIIHKFNNYDELQKTVKKLETYLLEDHGMKVEFKELPEYEFPAFEIPSLVTYQNIADILPGNVGFKAINTEIITLPDRETVETKYIFSEQDKEKKSQAMANHVLDKARLEAKLKAVQKEYKSQIDALEDDIFEESQKLVQGYEMREYHCIVKIDFKQDKKFFVDPHEPTTIRKVEPLEVKDRQVQLFHTVDEKHDPESIEFVNESAEDDVESESDGEIF